MVSRVCATPGCPTLVKQGARNGRCPACERAADRERGTRQQRGYDAAYDAIGRDYQRRMDDGERFICWRCRDPLGTRRGIDWHLGHDDRDRSVIRGPECPSCNLSTSSRRG
jgi:hypothetical protein